MLRAPKVGAESMSELLRQDLDRILASTLDLWDEVRGRRIFITGATGFFGCWLLETLIRANEQLDLNARVTVLTRNPDSLQKKAPHLAVNTALEILCGDVRTFEFPRGEFSHVIHAATESSAELNATHPMLMFDTIVEGTRRCLEFARAAGVRKFLLASSGAVYGTQPPRLTHISESYTGGPDPLDASSAYAEGKRTAELLCVLASRDSGLQAKIARCFAFVGPYMKLDAHFAIGNFIRDQLHGGPIRVNGDGTPLRSYMYASDLMVWLWTILFRAAPSRAYNVGSEQAISIAELAGAVSEALSPRVSVQVLAAPVPGALPKRYVPSTARAREELGLCCEVPLRQAIQRTQAWFCRSGMVLEAGR